MDSLSPISYQDLIPPQSLEQFRSVQEQRRQHLTRRRKIMTDFIPFEALRTSDGLVGFPQLDLDQLGLVIVREGMGLEVCGDGVKGSLIFRREKDARTQNWQEYTLRRGFSVQVFHVQVTITWGQGSLLIGFAQAAQASQFKKLITDGFAILEGSSSSHDGSPASR